MSVFDLVQFNVIKVYTRHHVRICDVKEGKKKKKIVQDNIAIYDDF